MSPSSGRYLTFSLAGEVYALELLDVTEIMELRPLTVVPMMPDFVRGVINLRGRVVPVVDLAARFGLPPTTPGRRTSIVIIEGGGAGSAEGRAAGGDIGVLVDQVHKVVHLEPGDVQPPPAFGAGIRADFIAGMAQHGDRFMIVLRVATVLDVEDMAHLAEATA